MAIVVEAVASSSGSGTSINVAYPASVAVGDLLLIHFVTDGVTITTLSGWTLIETDDETSVRMYSFYKLAEAGDVGQATVAWTTGNGFKAAQMFRMTGHHASAPLAASDVVSGALDTITIPGITPASEQSLILILVGSDPDGSARTCGSYAIATSPPTFSEHYEALFDSNNLFMAAASGIRSPSSATGDGTAVLDAGDPAVGMLIAITPQPVSATATPAAVALTSALPAFTLLISQVLSPSAFSLSTTLTAPTVTVGEQEIAWTNTAKNAASLTNTSKNAATPTNPSKTASTWTNTDKNL